jgi:hypothetical protein
MENSLKTMMEVLLFDEKIVGVRLGNHQTEGSKSQSDFIVDWK